MRLTILASLVGLCILACGSFGAHEGPHLVIVRPYVDVEGNQPDPANLGFTYYDKEFNCLINEELLVDSDPDKIVRITIHELLNTLVLQDREFPKDATWGWYVWDSDTLPPDWLIIPDEAAWISVHRQKHVKVKSEWLIEPAREACARINEAAGVEVFQID